MKNISQYLCYSPIYHSGKPVDKCELNLTTETPWILPRILSIDNMAWGEEETNHFENLKLLKGPSRYWKTTYTNEFYKKNGKENIKYIFLDNSFYEIGSYSEECVSFGSRQFTDSYSFRQITVLFRFRQITVLFSSRQINVPPSNCITDWKTPVYCTRPVLFKLLVSCM